nr:hypothetical protein [Crenobacter cavernae]
MFFTKDEHPRATSPEVLAKLKGIVSPDGTVTAGNASGVNDGAIALGHLLGASGARLVTTAAYQLARRGGRYALCTMCIGAGHRLDHRARITPRRNDAARLGRRLYRARARARQDRRLNHALYRP